MAKYHMIKKQTNYTVPSGIPFANSAVFPFISELRETATNAAEPPPDGGPCGEPGPRPAP